MHPSQLFRFIGVAFLCGSSISLATEGNSPVAATFTDNGRKMEVTGPGIKTFSTDFSMTVEVSGTRKVLRSTEGVPGPLLKKETEQTPCGEASVTVSTVEFPTDKLALELRVGQVSGLPCVLVQPILHNRGSQPVSLISLTALESRNLTLAGTPSDWIVTAYDQSSEGRRAFLVGKLSELQNGMGIREYGSIFRNDGTGFLFGPVGEPLAYLENRVTAQPDGGAMLQISSEMSGVRVDAGESRSGQQAILLMEPPRTALSRWAEWVSKTHGGRTQKGALAGWCSWYHLTNKIKGTDVLGVVDAVKKDPDRLRPQVIQIDDGYQDFDGKWDANAKFPEGMAFYAKRIAETGARPGLWMAMTMIGVQHPWLNEPENREAVWNNAFKKESSFRPDASGWLDPTHPRAKEHIIERIRHAVESGFTYLKLDFNNIGNGGWHEKKKTSFQILREHYQRIRKAAGEDTYILACIVEPNRAVLGLVDAHRTSHDAHRGGVRSAINDVLRSYHLNGRWMAVDNDIYYIAPDAKGIGRVQGGRNLHQTWLSMMGLSGGAALTSDPWHWDILKPERRTVEIMQPPAEIRTEVLDLGTSKEWPRLAAFVNRPWGNHAVALLWNPDERQPRTVTLDFSQAGLDPKRTHAVWSFWDNRFLGTAKGAWTTPPLGGWACQELVLTPIDGPDSGKPVLIGSNLHISGGVAEVKDVASSERGIKVTLTDAGAREGDIFFHSERPLRPAGASGCVIDAVEAAGDNVWKVRIGGRKVNQPQSFELTTTSPDAPARSADIPETCYLFAYFLNNGEDGLHLAWSPDGLKWQALKRGASCLRPEVGKSKLMRDPCITTGPDGTFHMVWTDSWNSGTIGYASSKDLVAWSPQKTLPVMANEPTTRNCWAPEIIYDPVSRNFRIFWASTIPGKFHETEMGGKNDLNHRIYSTTTTDFKTFAPTTLYFDPGHNVIDATLTEFAGKTIMIYKDESKIPSPMKNLKLATANSPAGPFSPVPGAINPPGSWVEGPTALCVGKEVILYFDAYTRNRYEALATTDFKTWRDVTGEISLPPGIRHGTAISVGGEVVKRLIHESALAQSS